MAKIDELLTSIVEQNLLKTERELDEQIFEFDDGLLSISCHWRIINEDKLVVGFDDIYEPENDDEELDDDFDYETSKTRRDRLLKEFIDSNKGLHVKDVLYDGIGSLRLIFSNEAVLEVFPTSAKNYEFNTFWRFVLKEDSSAGFSYGGYGIDYYDE